MLILTFFDKTKNGTLWYDIRDSKTSWKAFINCIHQNFLDFNK